ncbi:MAG: Hsp70 family protein [Pseudomonadota bacterium]
MTDFAVGIDLGTTNSCLAYINEKGLPVVSASAEDTPTVPSVVGQDRNGELMVGADAVQLGIKGGETVAEFKRHMGDTDYSWFTEADEFTPVDLSAAILRKLVNDTAARVGRRPTHAVVTVPAYFHNPERLATRQAIKMANLTELQIINEPTAAAIAYNATDKHEARHVLVYDLGGGTFDVSLLHFTGINALEITKVLTSQGDHHLGGVDWDYRLAAHLAQAFEAEHHSDPFADPVMLGHLMAVTENAKKSLSARTSVSVPVEAAGKRTECRVTRAQFEEITTDLVARTLLLTERAIEDAGLCKADIEEVVLVGGSTRMPMIGTALTEFFGFEPLKSVNPDEVVAVGAALLANELHEQQTTGTPAHRSRPVSSGGMVFRPIQDVTNHSLGMIAVNEQRDAYLNAIILPRDQPLPCEDLRPFRIRFNEPADELEIFVTQGESEDPAAVAYLGRYSVSNLPGTEYRAPSIVEVSYTYDAGGIVGVSARQSGQLEWVALDHGPVPEDVPDRFAEVPQVQANVEHMTVVLFIDVSGSMAGPPLEEAQKAAKEFVAGTDLTSSSIGIGVVSDHSRILLAPTQNGNQINSAIDSITCGSEGYGNAAHPFDTLYEALNPLQGMRAGVVLADGVWSNQPHAISRAERCHDTGIEIVGIGFGSADHRFIASISSASDLNIITSQSNLVEAFSSVAQVLNEKAGLGRV